MKKLMITIATLAVVATVNADIVVNWSGPAGYVENDGSTPIVPDPATALVQLIYSVDNIAGAALPGGLATGDLVLQEQLISETLTGNPYGALFSFSYTQPFVAGFLYVRVFESGTSTGGGVSPGDWYFTGSTFATVNNAGGANPPDDVHAGLAGTGPGPFGTYILNAQVVPEPGTLAFLGLGAIAMVVRRMRKA